MLNVVVWVCPVCRACYGTIPWRCVVCSPPVQRNGQVGEATATQEADEVDRAARTEGRCPSQTAAAKPHPEA
jgi:hypothetical protein